MIQSVSPDPTRSVLEVLKNAISIQSGPDLYCNHAQVSLSANDMILDFYLISPEVGNYEQLKAIHVQRIIIPLNMAKGLAGAVLEAVGMFEQQTGFTLFDTRGK